MTTMLPRWDVELTTRLDSTWQWEKLPLSLSETLLRNTTRQAQLETSHTATVYVCLFMSTSIVLPISWPRFNIKMISYHHRNSHCGDKTILGPSYIHNGIPYTSKTSLYWIGALVQTNIRYTVIGELFVPGKVGSYYTTGSHDIMSPTVRQLDAHIAHF